MATPNYDIDYNDKRFTDVETEKTAAINESNGTYDGIIDQVDKFYGDQIQASKDWADTQTKLQQEQTDFTIEKIEQQKDQTTKDYIKEQSGAYVDWQKQSDQYGANAEQMASAGLAGSGFSESSQVSMYNTYQNRVATAREVYNRAILNYDNAIKDARLQNNAILAEIAYTALTEQLTLATQGFRYKNDLIIEKANKKTELDNMYYQRWYNVLTQMNTENEQAEDVRQYNESMAEEKRQFDEQMAESKRQHDESMAEEKRQFNVLHSGSGGNGGSGGGSKIDKDNSSNTGNTSTVDKQQQQSKSAYDVLNALIASGASKDYVANQISLALRNGEITKEEAAKLRKTFTPRGLAY